MMERIQHHGGLSVTLREGDGGGLPPSLTGGYGKEGGGGCRVVCCTEGQKEEARRES